MTTETIKKVGNDARSRQQVIAEIICYTLPCRISDEVLNGTNERVIMATELAKITTV